MMLAEEKKTVYSSEALYSHMVNGWEVISADVPKRVWELIRPRLVNSEVEPDGREAQQGD